VLARVEAREDDDDDDDDEADGCDEASVIKANDDAMVCGFTSDNKRETSSNS
jgi:hypothetical protein